eukprot:CAMPEP_0202903122 /NCGR_PEP_ID=MMETSP1392-20130828/21865_1 /ASSEMBLY_ACC=CAM_ASM_000868 /TAXON_ID=225041 /ORGANISM="Chlamydomonas chlamydogama, Strain SAG 11-48b" /LENGTH=147 /DNA_ID=CAMNT_0049590113 /DNA_START=542 /DNA_END=985 /DNA_ORIENTATION=-
MKQILDWFLDTYYRHYKLYQYAFTSRVVMNTSQTHPLDVVELPPELPKLNDAMTDEQWQAQLTEEQKKVEQEERAAAEAAAAAEDEERNRRLREEYEAAVPDEIKDRVAAAVERELALLKKNMEEQFQSQLVVLQDKVQQLETRVPA